MKNHWNTTSLQQTSKQTNKQNKTNKQTNKQTNQSNRKKKKERESAYGWILIPPSSEIFDVG
jgi:hypothetical protein